MRFKWDEHKNRQNFRKHDVRFEDPCAITQRDVTLADEERWITVRAIGGDQSYGLFIRFMKNTTKKSFASSRLARLSP
jgi:uncharacterized DUF497 family protein